MMEILEFRKDDIHIFGIRGKLDAQTAQAFQDKVMQAVDGNERRLLLDCAGLEYLSSAGLRAILGIMQSLHARGGQLVFCSLSPQVSRTIELTGFLPSVPIFDSEQDALNHLAKEAAPPQP